MRSILTITVSALLLAAPAYAGSHGGAYMAEELMSPCQEADNDARWGEAAETECEQYIIGFVDALKATGMAGEGTKICPPELNTADEVRWAFLRWVHADYTARKKMPAADAMMGTLSEAFACGQ